MFRQKRGARQLFASRTALALTPAAVSRNVSVLERNLGLRLF
jgi:DNA-binding transcriptional LysR family regulator